MFGNFDTVLWLIKAHGSDWWWSWTAVIVLDHWIWLRQSRLKYDFFILCDRRSTPERRLWGTFSLPRWDRRAFWWVVKSVFLVWVDWHGAILEERAATSLDIAALSLLWLLKLSTTHGLLRDRDWADNCLNLASTSMSLFMGTTFRSCQIVSFGSRVLGAMKHRSDRTCYCSFACCCIGSWKVTSCIILDGQARWHLTSSKWLMMSM